MHPYPVSVMDYIERLRSFSNKQVNRAAADLITQPTDSEPFRQAVGLVTDWRTLHEGPVALFRPLLEERAADFPESLVVSRLKRIPTIIAKLKRPDRPKGMQLSTMQDIGGLRAVVNTVAEARTLAETLSDLPPHFELKRPITDYIEHPAKGGYRGLHLVYTYRSQNDTDRNLDGLRIELQVRTRLQHVWATAVEMVGNFRGESLKSGEGSPEWLEFFRLAGTLVEAKEHSSSPAESFPELVALRDRLMVRERMRNYSIAVQSMHNPFAQGSTYFVLTLDLDPENPTFGLHGFPPRFFEAAVKAYHEAEQLNVGKPIDTVLVSAESREDLEEAYPNYFAKVGDFIRLVYGEDAWPPKATEEPEQSP